MMPPRIQSREAKEPTTTKSLQVTTYRQHCDKWKDGCGATICEYASKVVLARGTIPCHVLFVGEAPGPSEDLIGAPFVGPAGQLLDRMIGTALNGRTDLKLAFTNLVGCIPKDDGGVKWHEPDEDSTIKCQDRLKEFIKLANPRVVVFVGKLTKEWINSGYKFQIKLDKDISTVEIAHPASILRAKVTNQGLMIQVCIGRLEELFSELK